KKPQHKHQKGSEKQNADASPAPSAQQAAAPNVPAHSSSPAPSAHSTSAPASSSFSSFSSHPSPFSSASSSFSLNTSAEIEAAAKLFAPLHQPQRSLDLLHDLNTRFDTAYSVQHSGAPES